MTVIDGVLRIGACVRHAAFDAGALQGTAGTLLRKVVRHIAHYPIRTRGTFCGNVANADPASEWCCIVAALGGVVVLPSRRGVRHLHAQEFFQGMMAMAPKEDQLIVAAELPLLQNDTRTGFEEFSGRKSDFAIAMALESYRLDKGVMVEPRLAIGAVEPIPRRVTGAEDAARAPSRRGFVRGSGQSGRSRDRPHGRYQQYRRVPPRPGAYAGRTRAGGRPMTGRRAITLAINGKDYDVTAEPRRKLANVIRDDCQQTSTYCGHGVCGACTVLVDGEPVRPCLIRRKQTATASVPSKGCNKAPSCTRCNERSCGTMPVRLLHAELSDARVSSKNGRTSMRRSSSTSCRQISAAALATQTSSKPCVPAQMI